MKVVDIYLILLNKLSHLPRNEVLIDLKSNSVTGNRIIWNGYDWSKAGEEWTEDAATCKGVDPIKWKTSLITGMISKYFTEDSVILEIGPGAGRWTAVLLELASRLILVDISEKALEICRERFKGHSNIEYALLEEPNLDFISDESVDYVWSYDVFVHINPTDTRKYIFQVQRILRPGGCAIIHHPDQVSKGTRVFGIRSYMNRKSFENTIDRCGMKIIEQNTNLVHFPGDVISVFRK